MTSILPLFSQELPKPFPFDVFPGIMKDYAEALCSFLQVADSIVGSDLLSIASLLVQHKGNISIDYRSIPLSLSTLIVADSGERKTTVDKIVLDPIRKKEKELTDNYPYFVDKYLRFHSLWKDRFIKTTAQSSENIQAMMNAKPKPPLHPKILMQEPTVEGIIKQFDIGNPSLGLFSDEGAKMLGGYSMGGHKEMASAGYLSNFWDGTPVERTRSSDKKTSLTLYDKRLTTCLMIQNIVFKRVWKNLFLQEQGLLARFLICQPSPKAGTRTYSNENHSEKLQLSQEKFNLRVLDLLDDLSSQTNTGHQKMGEKVFSEILDNCFSDQTRLKTNNTLFDPPHQAIDASQSIEKSKISLSSEAIEAYTKFTNAIEKKLGPDGMYHPIKSFASKSAEQSLRIAACLTLFESSDSFEITGKNYERGRVLAQWYLDETLRIHYRFDVDAYEKHKQSVLSLLESRWEKKKTGMSLREIIQNFPDKKLRKKALIFPLLKSLEQRKQVRSDGGVWEVFGQHANKI